MSRKAGEQAGAERDAYARWLEWGNRISLGTLVAAFLAYAFGVLEPWVPVSRLPEVWALPVERYLALTGTPHGWGWLRLIGTGDYTSYLGVALLGAVTAACYLRILASFASARDRVYFSIGLAQIAVLLLAASGLVSGR